MHIEGAMQNSLPSVIEIADNLDEVPASTSFNNKFG